MAVCAKEKGALEYRISFDRVRLLKMKQVETEIDSSTAAILRAAKIVLN